MQGSPVRQLLLQTDFMRFWWARLSGVTGNQMLMVAVAWHMYDLTDSAWDLGLVGLFQFVPALVFTLPAGHAADRWHRGRIYAACMLLQVLIALVLVLATAGEFINRELILGISVGLGVARAFQMPVQQALTPLLVPQDLLQRAIALSSSAQQVAVIGGPALGGLLYVGGAMWVYGSCAALMLLALIFALQVRLKVRPRHQAANLAMVLAGFTYIWRRKLLLGVISLDLFAVLLGGATALLPIYARDILDVGPAGLGLLRAAPAMGSLMVSLAMMRWPLHRHVGKRLLMATAVFGLSIIVFGLSTSFGLSMLALIVSGAADSVSVVTRVTLLQMDTPDELRGRVSAVNSIFIGASNQLGEFESGALAALAGPIAAVVLGGVGTILIAAGWYYLFPSLAKRDRMFDD